MVAGEVADRERPVCPRGPRPGPLEAWRVLPPDPGLALAVADRVSVSLQGIAGRGPTGGRVTRPGRDDRDLIGACCATRRSVISPAQRAEMGGGISGSDGLPGPERVTRGK